jgi:RNA polymerase sigma-70 factor (ECF subfamily)
MDLLDNQDGGAQLSAQEKQTLLLTELTESRREFLSYAKKMTGSHEDAEDILQALAIRILEKGQSYDNTRRAKPWLYAVLGGMIVDHRRKNTRHSKNVSADFSDSDAEYVPGTMQTSPQSKEKEPGEIVATQELAQLAINELRFLTKEKCICIELNVLGLKYREIAEHQNIPLGTVKSRISAGIRDLKTVLETDIAACGQLIS